MMSILFKSKIPPWAEVFSQIENLIANPKETPFCVGIPYGFQLQTEIWNPERLRVVRHVSSASGHSFISHHGVGKKNKINIWNFSKEKQSGNSAIGFQSISTDLKFLHILFAQRRWIYVMFCTDLSVRICSAKFHPLSTTAINKTVLSLAYNEVRDEIITGIAGGIVTWKFPIGQTDPLIPGQLISCSFTPFDWVMSIALDNSSKQIFAISDVRISMIDITTHKERCFFQKKCDISFTTCVFYAPASYFITGDKNGSVRAWSTSLNSFPMVTQFLGHTAEITKLLVHPTESLLFSSSLDKTIRVWNFDTCVQTFRLETGEEVIDMELLSGDLLYYHSHHHVKIWSLNLFHSLFTVLSSRIRRWSRVTSPGHPTRVLLHAEDGGVRLVSPVHGYELTTVLPITTMTADIVDVAHDPRKEKIYLVLSTREVLVFDSDTNPCCAHQLWVAESPDEGVCSLAIMNAEFAVHENEIPLKTALLFAGHYNGQISLVSGKDVYMRENVQAHQGQVTFLRVSASVSKSHDSLASYDHLVSCGTDCTVRIWQLIHPKIDRVSIQQKALIKLLQPPRDLAMVGNTLCMAMADNNVVMCRVKEEGKKGGANIFNTAKKTHEFLTHSKDEGHTAPINGLSCCSALGLFATSSEDHSVKIWNCDNQLVREMCFDESLCGVCFANSRGDILVGFQSHISLVTILNYLPTSYLEILSKMHFDNDPFEDHVQFDDMLKFWYDLERVPTMPLEAIKRRLFEPFEVKKPKKRKKKETVIVKMKTEDEEEMDLFQKRRASRRLSTRVHVMMALRRFSSAHTSTKANLSQVVNAMKQLVKDESTGKVEVDDKEVTPPLAREQETAKVYWPCAPDGFIPNSVVRKHIKPRKSPARLIPRVIRPEPKTEEAREEEEEEEEEDENKSKIKDFWTLWMTMQKTHVKETMSKESSKKKRKEKGGRKRRRIPEPASSKLGRRLPPRPEAARSEGPLMDLDEEEEMEEIEEEEEKEPEPEATEEEKDDEDYYEEVSEESPESSQEGSGIELLETPKEIAEESEEEEMVFIDDIDEYESSSSEGGSATSVMQLEIKSSASPFTLKRIIRKHWYPVLGRKRRMVPKLDEVLDNMIGVLPKVNSLKTIQDICQDFMSIEREYGIPEDKKVEIENQLIKLTYNEVPAVRQAAVWALGEMKVHRNDAYLTVVRRLVDNDKGTRKEAKKVLKTLTGVDTMEGLSELMMRTGVVHLDLRCNDNAVLMELAARLRQERKRKQKKVEEKGEAEKSASLDNLRTTLRRKPLKAKLRHPKTMKRRPRKQRRKKLQSSIFDEQASLSNTGKLMMTLKESELGCKLLQKMEPFRQDIIPGYSLTTSREKDGAKSLETGGRRRLSSIQKVELDLDEMRLDVRSVISKDGSFIPTASSRRFSRRDVRSAISEEGSFLPTVLSRGFSCEDLADIRSAISKEGSVLPTALSRRFSGKDLAASGREVVPSVPNVSIASVKSPDIIKSDYEKQRPQESRESLITLGPRKVSWRKCIDRSSSHSSELLTLSEILEVMDCVTGLNQRTAMLLLLKMKRTKRIIPRNIAQDDDTIQQFYTVGDLLEIICQLPPFDGVLMNLARKTSKSKEEILMSMRGLFRAESLITTERGNYVVINGLGSLPLKYQDALLRDRKEVLQNIEGFLGNIESLTSSRTENSKRFNSVLESVLWFCAILEPEVGDEDQLSCVASQERIQISERKARGHYIGPRTSLDTDVGREKKEQDIPPIFVQPSLQHCLLGPGTHGQRLLDSTLIRTKALSDTRLQSTRGTQDLVVTSLPHRLSVHTGNKAEGESHFGIMELTWRAGTPLQQLNDGTQAQTSSFPPLSCKPVELKEPFMLHSHGNKHARPKIPKSQSVPPLSNRKVKPFAEKALNLFRAVNSLNRQDSLVALGEYIKNQNIIKKKLLSGSFTNHPPPPNTATLISHQISPALQSLNNDFVTSVRSGDSSGRCSRFYELSRDMTRDTLLNEINKYRLPPISKIGGQNRSP